MFERTEVTNSGGIRGHPSGITLCMRAGQKVRVCATVQLGRGVYWVPVDTTAGWWGGWGWGELLLVRSTRYLVTGRGKEVWKKGENKTVSNSRVVSNYRVSQKLLGMSVTTSGGQSYSYSVTKKSNFLLFVVTTVLTFLYILNSSILITVAESLHLK
jgi:hypothetical protein